MSCCNKNPNTTATGNTTVPQCPTPRPSTQPSAIPSWGGACPQPGAPKPVPVGAMGGGGGAYERIDKALDAARGLACNVAADALPAFDASVRNLVARGVLSAAQGAALVGGARQMYAENCDDPAMSSTSSTSAVAVQAGGACCGGSSSSSSSTCCDGCASGATMTVNCLYRQPDITDCQAQTIQDDQTEGQIDIVGAADPGDPQTFIFDIPSPRMSATMCLDALQLFAVGGGDITATVTRVTMRGVYAGQTADGVPVLLLSKLASAAGQKLTITDGRCVCRGVCACQTAFHVVQVRVTVSGVAPVAARLLMDFTREWAENCGKACYECGIPIRCNQPLYVPAPPVP